jgi:putative flippase GtrA
MPICTLLAWYPICIVPRKAEDGRLLGWHRALMPVEIPVSAVISRSADSGEVLLPGNAIIVLRTRAKAGRAIKFGLVGCSGAAINTAVLYLLARGLGLPLPVASALAVEFAVISNYLLNDRWTFATRRPSVRRFAKFNLASLAGLSLNVMTVWLLARHGIYLLAANIVGIAVAFAANYAFSVAWVWRRVA